MRYRILLFIAALLMTPLLALGQSSDRDLLLASDGTLYTVESVASDTLKDVPASSTRALILTIQHGEDTVSAPVPASLNDGYHFTPALAYDSETHTLFIFWETMRNAGFTSDLSFCSYREGTWGAPVTLESVGWNLRQNLRIATTRKTTVEIDGKTDTIIPEITVHAAWWEISGEGEWPRYAMITMKDGNVIAKQVKDLKDFTASGDATPASGTPEQELLRHPALFAAPSQDSVDVVFGSIDANKLHRVTIKPVARAEGRLRIPIGVKERDLPVAIVAPTFASGDVSALSTATDNLAFYTASGREGLKYAVLKNGKWSLQSIGLTGKVTREAAVNALRRMLESE